MDPTCHGVRVFVGQTDKPYPNWQEGLIVTSSLGAAIGEHELVPISPLLAYVIALCLVLLVHSALVTAQLLG